MRPQTARELWGVLVEVLPGFAKDCPAEEIESDATMHSVMRDFTPYFSGSLERFSEKQLRSLGSFLNEAVSVDNDLESAVGTCFLEHLHQVRSYKAWAQFLSTIAKRKTRA